MVALTQFEHSPSGANTETKEVRSNPVLTMLHSNRIRFRVDPRDVPLEKAARQCWAATPPSGAALFFFADP